MEANRLIDNVGILPRGEETHGFLSFFFGEFWVGGRLDEAGEVSLVGDAVGTVNEASQDHAGDRALRSAEPFIIEER